MLVKHSGMYLLARGLPGAINFLAIALYTRLLAPEEYGRYALVLAGVGLFNVVFFQWLRLSLLRFLPSHLANLKPLLATILVSFSALVLFTGVLGVLLACLWPDPTWRGLMLLAVPLLWLQAWFDLNLELARSQLRPLRYGLMSGSRSVTALSLGGLLVLWGLGVAGPLIGGLLATLLVGTAGSWQVWRGLAFMPSRPLALDLLRYGLPLTATFALGFVVSASDRFLIAAFLGERAAGMYAAGYDIAQNSLTLLMMIVNLAAYPLLVRALEEKGPAFAQEQARKNATAILVVGMPASAGFAILAPNIAFVMLGGAFREQAALLLPIISLASLVAGIKAFHFDLAFQLGRSTFGQVRVLSVAALVNVLLNVWWVPIFELQGAAYATLVAYSVGLVLSVIWGRRTFVMPFPLHDFMKLILACIIMLLAVWPLLPCSGARGLVVQVLVGMTAYSLAAVLLNIAGSRSRVYNFLRRGA